MKGLIVEFISTGNKFNNRTSFAMMLNRSYWSWYHYFFFPCFMVVLHY